MSQSGPGRCRAIGAESDTFSDDCTLSRVQSEGWFAVSYTAQGVWTMGAEAANWAWCTNAVQTGAAQIGTTIYTFTGRALGARAMVFDVAPEISVS